MFLGYLRDMSDDPEAFLDSCSEEERRNFWDKYRSALIRGVKEEDQEKMGRIRAAFEELGFK